MESAGEMLLIRYISQGMEVFKLDTARNVLEPTRCIGSRALFLGDRCLSVDTDKFPSIDDNCIFFTDYDQREIGTIYMYNLTEEKKEMISDVIDTYDINYNFQRCADNIPPFTLIQLFLHYCTDIPCPQLELEQ